MSSTIFCTFEQQDLADLAMGQVRQIQGVKTIHYIIDHAAHQRIRNSVSRATNGMGGNAGIGGVVGMGGATSGMGWTNAGWFSAGTVTTGEVPGLPATVKITCADEARKRVVSKLVNLHAYKIVTTP